MKRKKRILFGAVDIGYRIELYTKFIDENLSDKLKAESFSKYVLPEEHYKTNYTYTCPIDKTHPLLIYLYCFGFFIFSLFRYDIFHFLSGETILTRKLRRFELATYKLFGKRVIMHFVGSDIRSNEYLNWKEKNILKFLEGQDDYPKSEPWQKKLIRDAEKFADSILVSTPDLLELIPTAAYFPVMLDLEKFIFELNETKTSQTEKNEVVILFCPSSTKVNFKGTNYVKDILKKISANPKYNIKIILPAENKIEGSTDYPVSRYELFQLFNQADIVIDQMIIGWYGLLSVEALSAQTQTICYVDKKLEHFLFTNCPINLADVNTLETVIIKCVERVQNKQTDELKKQIEWIKSYHVIENNNDALLKAWNLNHSE